MKKIISGILAILLVASIGFGAFAAPSVDKVVGASTPNGGYIFYIFGKDVSENATEAGITIEGKDENYKLQYFPESEEDTLQDALVEGKYGIGINDSKNLLGNTFRAAPYEIVNDEKVVGEYVTINKGEAETADYAGLSKLYINGKAAPGFYTGTPETDFYYGLEELPETAEGLPAIEIASNHGELVKGEIESYYGGYTVPYSVEFTNVNGNEFKKTFNIHFRKFSDKVVSVRPTSAYRVHWTYLDHSKVEMMNLQSQTGSINMALNTASDVPSNKDTYIYVSYDVDEIEGYAPVSYDLTGLRVRYNPMDIYSYDGDLSNVVLPTTEEDALEKAGMFSEFKGYNPVSAFHLLGVEGDLDENNYILSEPGVVATTTSVTEGNNILIYRSRFPQTGPYPAYIYYRGDMANYQMKINVRYVEKNPVDITASDATMKSVSYNGKEADGFDEATSTYYYGVESFDNFEFSLDSVSAEAKINGAYVAYGQYNEALKELPVYVIAKDGETEKEYKIIFKEIQHKTINWSNLPYLHYENSKYSSGNYNANKNLLGRRPAEEMETSATTVTYAEFSTEGLENFAVAGKSYFNAIPRYNTTYLLYNTTYETISKTNTFDEIKNGEADLLATLTCKGGDGKAGNAYSFEIDSALIKPKANGKIYIGLVGEFTGTNAVLKDISDTEPMNLELGYITMEPNVDPESNDTSISSVKVNGEETLYYDEAKKTYYFGVDSLETFDFDNCDIEVVTTAPGAEGFGFADSTTKSAEIEVTSKDGSVTETYTLKFKEIAYKTVTPTIMLLEYVPESDKYQTGEKTYSSTSTPTDGILGAAARTHVSYLVIPTQELGSFALAGKSTVSVTPTRYDTYVFFDSMYDSISKTCRYTEIIEGTAPELGRYVCARSNSDLVLEEANNIKIDSAKLSVKDNGNIVIGVYDGNANGTTGILNNISVSLGYIEIN